MKYLTADFGSTYTKLTAIDASKAEILGTCDEGLQPCFAKTRR